MELEIIREISKEGANTLKVNGYYLHSKYSPLKEAKRFVENEYKPHHLHVIFGYGLGYIVDTLISKLQFNEPILVIDPIWNEEEFQKFYNVYSRLYFLNSKEEVEIMKMLDLLAGYTTKVHMIISINYNKLFPEEIKKILEFINNNQYKQGANIATAKLFAKQWQENFLLNSANIVNDNSLNILELKYDSPVVIASGGPSLIKQIETLKIYRNDYLLICAGSTINALLSNGLKPDYVVSVDGGEVNHRHFENIQTDETVSLMYSPTNHYKIREIFNGNCYGFIPSVKPKDQIYYKERFGKNLPLIDGGGSVAHFALSIAKYITTGPIALVGQDLALTNNKTHATGVKGASESNNIPNNKKVYVEGYYGDEVLTTQTLKIMLNSFSEPPLLDVERKNVWNCTEGGAKIKSIEQMPLISFFEQYAKSPVRKLELNDYIKQNIELKTFLRTELENYDQIKMLLKNGMRIIEKSAGTVFTKNELNKIGEIERKLNALYKKHSLETLLEPIFDRCAKEYLPTVGETKQEANIRAKKYALDLYTSCLEQLAKFIEDIQTKGV